MSQDFQVVAFQDAATLRQVGLRLTPVPTLDIYGKDFNSVSRVLVNGVASPEFIVLSRDHLLAAIPPTLYSTAITSVRVLSDREIATPLSVISFEAAVGNRVAEGRVRLVQSFLMLLLTEPGSDIFMPELGGGLYALSGAALTPADLRAEVSRAVERTRSQLVRIQTGDTRLADSELLRSAEIRETSLDSLNSTLRVSLRLTAMDGTTADASLVV